MRNSALVVVDMLYDFIDGSLACQNAEQAVNETLSFIDSQTRSQGGEEDLLWLKMRIGSTHLYFNFLDKDLNITNGGNIEAAKLVGKSIAEKANKANIKTVVFDRGGYLYHGRVKALADAARENGLEF